MCSWIPHKGEHQLTMKFKFKPSIHIFNIHLQLCKSEECEEPACWLELYSEDANMDIRIENVYEFNKHRPSYCPKKKGHIDIH